MIELQAVLRQLAGHHCPASACSCGQRMYMCSTVYACVVHAHEQSVIMQSTNKQLCVAAGAAVRAGRGLYILPGRAQAHQRDLHLHLAVGALPCAGRVESACVLLHSAFFTGTRTELSAMRTQEL